MKYLFVFNSISKKFLFPTLILSVILFTGLGIFMARSNSASIRSMMDSRGESVASFVTRISAEYFVIFDFQDFENFVKALESDPEVDFAVFYNSEMEPLTSVEKMPKDTSSLIIYDQEILDEGGGLLGYLKLGYNSTKLSESLNRNMKIVFFTILISLTLLTIGIAILVRKVITERVKATVEMLKDIAQGEGDLTKRLHSNSKDELGDLAQWFNTFVNNLREIIATVQANAERVSIASAELASTAESLNKGSNDQKIHTEQIASAMTQMSRSITDIVENASRSAESSMEASGIAAQGKEVVEKTVKGMERIEATVNETSKIIEKLGKSSDEIGNILRVINDIAEQTNLLALNAAIEAARAGDHGRGFSVVAGEVKKLAESTGVATKEIAEMIVKIQKDTETSVMAMSVGKDEVNEGVKLAEEAMNSLQVIVEASRNAATTVQIIAQAANEQSASTEQVAQSMDNMLEYTQKSAEATNQIELSSDDLEKLSSELHNKIGWFKI